MSQVRRRVFNSWPVFCGAATVAFALLGASTALAILDAVTLNLRVKSWGAISITAAVTGCISLFFILVLTICRLGCSGAWFHRWVLPWLGALVSVIAAVFSINALVLKAINPDEVKRAQRGRSDATGQLALWVTAIVSEAAFYTIVMLRTGDTTPASPIRKEKSAPRRPITPPTPLRIIAPPYPLAQVSTPFPPSVSLNAESKRSSWRDSLVSLRPNNSRTKLLSSRVTLSRGSSVRSAATTHSDAFDSWDTSHVDLSIREAISPAVPSKGTALETIPGSRPASPARALDGPFPRLEDYSTTFATLSERPATAQSQASLTQQRIKRTFIPATRPMSPSNADGDESHIHPLFRTDSPTPPPGISRDTIVTASPMGGHIMTTPILPRPASRMRSASQLSSRATSRADSRAPSRASSIDELPSTARRAQSVDERRPLNSAFTSSSPYPPSSPFATSTVAGSPLGRKAEFSDESRSPSPINRGLTPPIPEFILSAKKEGPRSQSSNETLRMGPRRVGG